MKEMIIGFVLLTSVSAFAGADNCKGLAGKYTCKYEGQNVALTIAIKSSTNSAVLSIGSEGDEVILDGKSHNSKVDDSQNIAVCKNNEIIVDNYFRGQLKGSTSVAATTTGVLYTMVQDNSNVELSCKRN